MKVLDLFSGIGGFSLGLERAGMKTIAFCEIDKKCQMVLNKHWPRVKKYSNIKELTLNQLLSDGIKKPDVICGGFPCQDISTSGKKKGIDGEKSGLWFEYLRIISEVRPRFSIIENTANLIYGNGGSWFSRLLSGLASIGYDAEWHIISACSVGAPHLRQRVWVIAYPQGGRQGSIFVKPRVFQEKGKSGTGFAGNSSAFTWWKNKIRNVWEAGSGLVRVSDGIPGRMDRIKQLGNSVIPQIPELIGRAIMESCK